MTYEMLTGKLPFQGRTQQEMMIARLRSDPTPLRKMRPELDFPESVERVLEQGDAAESRRSISDGDGVRRRVRRGGRRAERGIAVERERTCSASCSDGDDDTRRCVRHAGRDVAAIARHLRRATRARAQQDRPYRPAFDVVDYDIAIDLPDTGATIHANATLTVTTHGARATRSCSTCSISRSNSVTVDGRAVKFARGPETIAIPLPTKRGTNPTYQVVGRLRRRGHRRTDRARRQRGALDVLRRQLAESRASLDSEHRSSERQGDGDVARDARPSSQTVVANGKLVSTRAVRDATAASERRRCGASRSGFRSISW